MTDPRVLEELLFLKEESLKVRDIAFKKLTQELSNRLGNIETMLEEDRFFPAAVLREIQGLKQLIMVAR